MSEQTIQSQDIRISEVFQAFYSVPEYQREYVWEAEQVEQLLSDINSELAGSDPASAPEYFIGSIVVCPGQDGILELIDGQQRMTTLFLTLCAIRDRLIELGAEPSTALGAQIAATSVDVSGNEHFRYRLDLQYEDSGDVLSRIAARNGERAGMQKTRSVANILNAYEVVLTFLRREFGDDVADLRAFYGYVINKVKLIRIRTEDVAKALKIFETINDRGVGLDSMDLLKNLLFMRARRTDFDKLKGRWKELQDTIFEMGEKPLRFLATTSSAIMTWTYSARIKSMDGWQRTRRAADTERTRWDSPPICSQARRPIGTSSADAMSVARRTAFWKTCSFLAAGQPASI